MFLKHSSKRSTASRFANVLSVLRTAYATADGTVARTRASRDSPTHKWFATYHLCRPAKASATLSATATLCELIAELCCESAALDTWRSRLLSQILDRETERGDRVTARRAPGELPHNYVNGPVGQHWHGQSHHISCHSHHLNHHHHHHPRTRGQGSHDRFATGSAASGRALPSIARSALHLVLDLVLAPEILLVNEYSKTL